MKNQSVPLLLTFLTFLVLCGLLFCTLLALNKIPGTTPVLLHLRFADILIGLTIYVKTSVDFALFIGNLMHHNPGVKNRIAIEIGTSLGNALGTIAVLLIWSFFRNVPTLLIGMILLASLILLQMAEEGIAELIESTSLNQMFTSSINALLRMLQTVNRYPKLLTARLLPGTRMTAKSFPAFRLLLLFSFTIPFLLGLDDFAGYIPLFSVVNVFGFSIGVFFGHMLLTSMLFLSPAKTTRIVRHPLILLLGSMFLIGIAGIGILDVIHIAF